MESKFRRKLNETMTIRQSGDTLGNIMLAIGQARKFPEMPVVINDEDLNHNLAARRCLRDLAKKMIFQLDLKDIKVTIFKNQVTVTSHYFGKIDSIQGIEFCRDATKEDWLKTYKD